MLPDGNVHFPGGAKHRPSGSYGGLVCGACEKILARLIYIRVGYVCTVLTIVTPYGKDNYCQPQGNL
jgi:hypothetical protein